MSNPGHAVLFVAGRRTPVRLYWPCFARIIALAGRWPEEISLSARNRLLDVALLTIALLGPFFHLLGILLRGLTLFYANYSRLGFIYGVLAFSAVAAALLWLRRRSWAIRLIAGAALVVNLGSIAYAGSLWSREMREALANAALVPIASHQVGILVAPADESQAALAGVKALERNLKEIVQQYGLQEHVDLRRVYPLASAEQARRLAERLRANIVLWQPTPDRCTWTVLGANETEIELSPSSLMLLMTTQHTFTPSFEGGDAQDAAQAATVAAPTAAGFAALALGQPVVAVAQFRQALGASGTTTITRRTLYNYLGTALLYADRPDLAIQEFNRAKEIAPDAYTWSGIGIVFMLRREWAEALEAFQAAVAVDPYSPLGYCGLGIIRAREGDIFRAIATYQQAIALCPDWGAPYALLGMAYELEGKAEAARQAYQAAGLRAGPNAGFHVAVLERADAVLRNPPTAIPTATRRPLPTPTPVPTSAIYIVQKNDTLRSIADKFGVTVDAIVELNQLDDPNMLVVGQRLIIPQKR